MNADAGQHDRLYGSAWRGWLFAGFPVAIIAVFVAIPTVIGIGLSFFNWGGGPLTFIGVGNYQAALFHDPQLWRSLRNTISFTLFTVPPTVLLGFLIACALHARWFRGRAVMRTLYFLPTVMSIVAVGFIWQWMLNPRAGLLNAILGSAIGGVDWLGDTKLGLGTLIVVQVWRNLGFFVVLYAAALSRVPHSLYEAASIDCAGGWRRMWTISWPAVWPMTVFLFVIGTIWALQVFDLDLVMTGDAPQEWLDMINMHLFREFKNARLGYASTIGVLILILTAAVTIAQFWWVRRRGRTLQ